MRIILAWLFSTSLAFAQLGPGGGALGPGGGSGGGGGGGSGTVTSIATGCQATGGTITTTGTISTAETVNLQTGANYAILSTDCGALVNLSNASAQVPTIAQAGTAGFASGYFVDVCNIGAGTQTLTPATSTIYGAATYVLPAGNVNPQCARVVSDGANYQVITPITKTAITQAQADNSTKLATTAYTDLAVANAIAGVNPAISVNAATTAASDTSGCTYNNGASGIGATLTCEVNTAKVIDGFTFNTITTQSLLVKNDTQAPSGAFNGIYNLTAVQTGITGAIFTRRLDYDTPSDMNNTGAVPVISGTVNATTSWLLTTNIVTVGTTALSYTQFSINPTNIVQGPASSTNSDVALFNGTGGKTIKDGGTFTSNLPAFTGDCTTSAGAVAVTCALKPPAPDYISGDWHHPVHNLTSAAGSPITASTTMYCLFGGVGQSVTIKTLGTRVATGVAASNVEMAIYSVGTTTMTLVDTSAAQASSVTSASNPTTTLANTTDVLSSGTLYGWCLAGSGAITPTSFATTSLSAANFIGSSTIANITSGTANKIGLSFPVTYSATPSSTFPSPVTISTGTDVTTSIIPQIVFQVN